jgi:hypothetical protein
VTFPSSGQSFCFYGGRRIEEIPQFGSVERCALRVYPARDNNPTIRKERGGVSRPPGKACYGGQRKRFRLNFEDFRDFHNMPILTDATENEDCPVR